MFYLVAKVLFECSGWLLENWYLLGKCLGANVLLGVYQGVLAGIW